MELLVTGGGGYIGSIVCEELILQGYRVITMDNFQEGNREAILPDVTLYEGDFGDKQLLETVFSKHSIEAVLHFAAETTIEFSMTDPAKYFKNNLINGVTLLDVMLKYDCRDFIFSSTAATYGEPQYTPIDEDHPQQPINAYGESKLMFEKVLDWYHRAYNVRYNAFRYFNVAGASEKLGESHKHESHLIPLIIQTIMGKRSHLHIFGNDYDTKDGTCIRDYIHVKDLAQAHIIALKNLAKNPNDCYNLGNGSGFSVKEVVQTVEQVTDKKVLIRETTRRQGDPAVLIASSNKAKQILGWKPAYELLSVIVESAWKWHREHPDGYDK